MIIRTCRGCGCDDSRACLTDEGPCSWFMVDVGQPTGICTVCAERLGLMVIIEPGEQEAA
jgi:hypothetical protein